jgi:hypothetical protein
MQPMDERNAKIDLGAGSPSAEEAAAAIAALEMMLRETAGAPTGGSREPDRWRETALIEGVQRDASADLREPWIKT